MGLLNKSLLLHKPMHKENEKMVLNQFISSIFVAIVLPIYSGAIEYDRTIPQPFRIQGRTGHLTT